MATVLTALGNRFLAGYYDGERPLRHAAVVEFCVGELRVALQGSDFCWPYAELHVVSDGRFAEPIRIERISGSIGEAIVIPDPRAMEVVLQYPEIQVLRPPLLAGLKGWPAVLLTCAVMAVFGSMVYFWGMNVIADTMAAITPPFVEDRLGKAVVNILAPPEMRCTNARRAQLLSPVADRLQAALGPGYRLEVVYTAHPIPNAFAAPGGHIVVFQGLLDQTQNPEEFAAVLAHEMMHVRYRHSLRALTRHVSARTLLSVMAMDSAGTPAAMEGVVGLGNLRYQRDDEEQADLEGARLLEKAGIDPGAMVSFFRRLAGDPRFSDAGFTYFSSHPALLDRARKVEREVPSEGKPTTRILSQTDWLMARVGCLN